MRRAALLVLVLASTARADERIAANGSADDASDLVASAAVGAGGQGHATYGALDLALTAFVPHARIGLRARAVWDDGVFRRSDWSRAADAVTVIRDVEASYGPVALAAGRLAPAHVAHLADGYRTALDDRWRTGARVALATTDDSGGALVTGGAEIDDVLDPALIAAHARWQLAPAWAIHAAFADDPAHVEAGELGLARTLRGDHAQLDVGAALTIDAGPAALAFTTATLERGDARYTLRADVRAGETASAFGPLYRIERTRMVVGHTGLGAGLVVAAAAPTGSVELQLRERPGLGGLAAVAGAVPMSRTVQAAAWAAVSRTDAAGAAELRIAWARQLFSALQAARFHRLDEAMPAPIWSVTAWFGATTE